jgi:hypothetical protein
MQSDGTRKWCEVTGPGIGFTSTLNLVIKNGSASMAQVTTPGHRVVNTDLMFEATPLVPSRAYKASVSGSPLRPHVRKDGIEISCNFGNRSLAVEQIMKQLALIAALLTSQPPRPDGQPAQAECRRVVRLVDAKEKEIA